MNQVKKKIKSKVKTQVTKVQKAKKEVDKKILAAAKPRFNALKKQLFDKTEKYSEERELVLQVGLKVLDKAKKVRQTLRRN